MIRRLAIVSLIGLAGAAEKTVKGDKVQNLEKKAVHAHTCGALKKFYKDQSCCKNPDKATYRQLIPTGKLAGTNPCEGTKPKPGAGFDNKPCFIDDVVNAVEQAGADVSVGYTGSLPTNATPINTSYFEAGLCPVNVHWHLGAEHRSQGEFDENGKGHTKHLHDVTKDDTSDSGGRRLALTARLGLRCYHYKENDAKFNTEYDWLHCKDMHVGETYEVHWPHSSMGACGTPNQYQTPFYDGVFCNYPNGFKGTTQATVGVHAQVFTIVNDESYYYPDMIRGMIIDGEMGKYVTKYTGSTTGTSRDNKVCSGYAPITWQVDRKCHLISASSFDKMCADMKAQRDDMSGDLYPHGSRQLVADNLTANNHQNRL